MTTSPAASLIPFLASVPDPRSAHGRRHPLSAMLAAVCCAILCGARGFKPIAQGVHDQDITLIHALGFNRTPPKWGAFRKLLVALSPEAFEAALARWAEAALAGMPPEPGGDAPEPVALDGKSVRGSIGRHEGAVHLLAVMAQRCGLTLRQTEVGSKTNEHKAALGLLKGLVLEGRVERAQGTSRPGDLVAVVAGALGDREPLALRAGRDHGRRCQPDPNRVRPSDPGGLPQRGHRLVASAGRQQHRRGAPT